GGELADKAVAIDAQHPRPEPHDVQVPGMLDVGSGDGELQGIEVPERRGVPRDDLSPPCLERAELAQLLQSDGGGDVTHVVLEAGLDDVVAPGSPLLIAPPGVMTH